MEWLAEQLQAIPGVVAVTLGGSRARGEQRPDSDWTSGCTTGGDLTPTACGRWITPAPWLTQASGVG